MQSRRVGTKIGCSRQAYLLTCFLTTVCAAWATACGPSAPEPAATAALAPRLERPVVLFLGTSLTAGYGLPSEQAYPALLQQRIDEAGAGFEVVNAGVSGDTSAGGLRRIDWLLRQPVAVLVLELGGNDMLRGLDVDTMQANLATIIERTRAAHPEARILVAGMRAAPNLGRTYAESFDASFGTLAKRYDAALIPFLLEGVAAIRELNQPDGIHPTEAGHRILADTVWRSLEPLLPRN